MLVSTFSVTNYKGSKDSKSANHLGIWGEELQGQAR